MNDRVTIDDVRRAGHCVSGARRWFEGHGMDFRRFLKDGLPVDEFLAASDNDALAVNVVTHMREGRRVEI